MEKEDFNVSWAKSLPKAADHVPRPGGFWNTADGAIKGRNVAKVAAGTGAVGLGSWMIFDNNAGEKLGAGLGNVGSGIGGGLGGLFGGLGQGLFGALLVPGGLSCCCCLVCAIIAYMKMS
jgi:hypothetical protein